MNRKSIVLIVPFALAIILGATLAISRASETAAEKPVWKIGDTWTFQRSVNGKFAYFRTFIVVDANASFEGRECYKLEYQSSSKDGKVYDEYRRWDYLSYELVYLGSEKPDGTIEKPYGGNEIEIFKWPLKDKKFWRQEWNEPNSSRRADSIFWVSREKITVPAGEFETFKILHEFEYARGKGKNFNEFWYSPEAKYVVKQYTRFDNSTDELVSYQVH